MMLLVPFFGRCLLDLVFALGIDFWKVFFSPGLGVFFPGFIGIFCNCFSIREFVAPCIDLKRIIFADSKNKTSVLRIHVKKFKKCNFRLENIKF